MDTPISKTDAAMSIVNYPAARLPGPGLLHLLVQNSSPEGQLAVDFLASNDARIFLSYDEFHRAAEALALRISALARPWRDSNTFVVPVLVPQSPQLYIALLAVLKAGGAFCPMNLDVPLERAKFILKDVSARVIITTAELASKLPQGDHDQTLLIIDRNAPDETPAETSHRTADPSDLAYVMYTSGSTGMPKGVGVSHGAATQSLLAHDRHIPQFSRFLQFAAPTFDVSVFEIFFPFLRGKTLVGCSRSAMLNDLPGVIRKLDVDACELTPSVAGSLLRTRDNAPCLRLLMTIGEMLTLPVVEEFGGSEDRQSMLWGMYGPTEAAIHCTLQPEFAQDSTVRNIGIPLDTVSAFILEILENDETSPGIKVLPQGQVGELAVGGYQIADGYLNKPNQTLSAFIDTPYGRLYRTGDKARLLSDGRLECLGRISDGQVKLRGQRMELGEIEHAALRTPGCHSAVAAVIDATLVLFCAVDETKDMAVAIMESCREWLPGSMLPGDIVVADNFPRLASGKVDRKQLVADYETRTTQTPNTICYKNELEEQLCILASFSLGVNVHPTQDLSRIGLDSLSSIKLASVLRGAGVNVGAIDVLGARTISVLSSHLQSVAEIQPGAPEPAPKAQDSTELADILASHPVLSQNPQPIATVVPCTPLQASMLAATMADSRAYCNWIELGVSHGHQEGLVRSWVLKVAQANEILRTGFIHDQGQFLQVVFETFDESNILSAGSVVRDFDMRDDDAFLRPFRVQLSTSDSGDMTVILQLHHAVYDGWSLDILLSDLDALAHGQELDSKPQFQQIAAYQQTLAFSESCDAAREYWAGNLLGFQPASFPVLTSKIDNTSTVLSEITSLKLNPEDLKVALQGIGCGPQTIFQAALAWLWSSMVGNEDVVVGSIQSGRTMPIPGIENIIGPCIAAAPLRTDLSQVRTIRDLLLGIQAGNRAALPHSVLPLSEIKRAAGIRSGHPIYDVLFIYQESLHSKDQSMAAFKLAAHQDYLETKLLVEVEPGETTFKCRFTYHLNAVPAAQLSILLDSISPLVVYMLENFDSRISSMRNAIPQQLLSIFNPRPSAFGGIPDLAYAVERIAAGFPEKDAVCFADHISDGALTTTTITFGELNRTAERIAWQLVQHGAREGGVVAIAMQKSIRLYAGILAILKVGCAYLPLLPSTPFDRIETILDQAGVELCVADTSTTSKLSRLRCHVLDVQTLSLGPAPLSRAKPKPDPDRLAYIIYTSGSTGVPKGVCVTQLNIMSNLNVLSRIYSVKERSRLLQSCSQAFDVSVFEIFFAWTRGMCLCSATNDTLFEDLETSIRKLKVTHLSMTPTVASLVDPANTPRVEILVTAGEAMSEAVARKWGDKLYQGYGPSETTNICSVKKMGQGQVIQHLGWSLGNTSTFVLARDCMEVVPFGCVGEFCFGGDQVAQGYLHMEELTSAKFINHPTLGRIYRSGDLGRMLPDGSMVIVGRVDEQVKIRGQRVELEEITEAIRESDSTADCTTLFLHAKETTIQDKIVSFLVPKQREGIHFQTLGLDSQLQLEIQTLFQLLESRLPTYMIPSAIIPITVLPTTASGKLDRARLKEVFRDLDHEDLVLVSQGAFLDVDDEEWSDAETQIADAVSHCLRMDRRDIQRWTPLTTLGLDSISAIQLSRGLHTQLGRRFPISLILQNASVARLAKVLPVLDISGPPDQEIRGLLPKSLVDNIIKRLGKVGTLFSRILPCTALQEAMLASLGSQGRYLNHMLFRINGDLTELKASWNAMCARHDILRTCFVATDDHRRPILQIVLDKWHAPWHNFDASHSTLEDCISQHLQKVPHAVDSMKPTTTFATITQDNEAYLSFVCHHALYDGVAMERMLYEVEQHFSGSPLPPVTSSYEQFLHQSLTLPASTDDFWLEHLADYEPKLITNLNSNLAETRISRLISRTDVPLSLVNSRARELGISLLALAQSAWAISLGSLFGTGDICFGNVINGRSLPIEGISELVAPCFNTIPVRMDLTQRQRNIDLMKTFQSANTQFMQYQFTPIRHIQSLFSQKGIQRLFDTLLLLQQPPRDLDQSLWTLERDEGEMDVSWHPNHQEEVGATANKTRSLLYVK